MYNNDAEHRAKVDDYDPRPGSKLAPQKVETTGVAENSRVLFRIKRQGIFLEGQDVKRACHNSTYKQLGIDEKSMTFPIQVQEGTDHAVSGYLFMSDKEKAMTAEVSLEMSLGVDSIIKSSSQGAPAGVDQMAMAWARQNGFWKNADGLSDFLRGKGLTLGEVRERGWKAEEKRLTKGGSQKLRNVKEMTMNLPHPGIPTAIQTLTLPIGFFLGTVRVLLQLLVQTIHRLLQRHL